ncbi:hypothetical protein K1T71_015252 [Dendrolimus kikuchii]|nr:hypothetical protein K1T71_015252 [Dendrolimus kikuchii]
MAEWEVGLAVISEPYYVPTQSNWVGDLDDTVAVVASSGAGTPLIEIERGRGYAVAGWGEHTFIGVYFSPNRPLAEFERFLDSVRAAVGRQSPRATFVLGDFNAKSRSWGNTVTELRGLAVETWAFQSGLTLLNRGSVHTCVRARGGSVVDLSFATHAIARRVMNWKVEEEVETLSDHLYIRFEVSPPPNRIGSNPPRSHGQFPRWAISRLDPELAEEMAVVQGWTNLESNTCPEDLAEGMRRTLTRVCDASMPRSRRRRRKPAVYWWTAEIGSLREAALRARRSLKNCRRRHPPDRGEEEHRLEEYRAAKKALQVAICQAKTRAREEILSSLDADPWGRPYRVARKKMRACSTPVTESLPDGVLNRIVDGLFPDPGAFTPPTMCPPQNVPSETDPPPVSEEEWKRPWIDSGAGKRHRDRTGTGEFPKQWKEGRLCLIPKEGRPPEDPSAYRPIVLLDEVAKVFEKILASRLVQHLDSGGPGLSEAQYGFRSGRSTLDALFALRSLTREAESIEESVLVVSLDIQNAFNSLPFETILEALRSHGVPLYLVRLLKAYLQDRFILWEGGFGQISGRRRVVCGVPQGSVLGPILWNIGYDWLLREPVLPGMGVICYADDTLITARGGTYDESVELANAATALVVERVRRLGLRVSPEKTEALMFYGRRRQPPRGTHVAVQGVAVAVKAQMKYLGLVLDGKWNFGAHFTQLAPRLLGAAAALARLLPNVGGPGTACRKLYTGVLRSMALYGAPVWVDSLHRKNRTLLRRSQRVLAVRAIRGYRTVSWTAATLLASDPPWELQAETLAAVHRYRQDTRDRGERPCPAVVRRIRVLATEALIQDWADDLRTPEAGAETVAAVRPHLSRWVSRKYGTLTYRLTQILTGHGCFGKYLHQTAGREPTPECAECGAPSDTAYHTLVECAAWGPQRHQLESSVGPVSSLQQMVEAMLSSEDGWRAVSSFSETVMSLKEAAERTREVDAYADPIRRRRTGGRRRRYAAHLP